MCLGTGTQTFTNIYNQATKQPCSNCQAKGFAVPASDTCQACMGSCLTEETHRVEVDIPPGTLWVEKGGGGGGEGRAGAGGIDARLRHT